MSPQNLILLILAASLLGAVMGCSDSLVIVEKPVLIDVKGGFDPGDYDFKLRFDWVATADGVQPGPLVLYGELVGYDPEAAAHVVDLTVINTGQKPFPLPVTLTFTALLPDGVEIANPDNGIYGPGAMIEFHFTNRDLEWSPGERSQPRRTLFAALPDQSVGFATHIEVGMAGQTIGGRVWHDTNEDGIEDADEEGLGGYTMLLYPGDMSIPTFADPTRRATTRDDGTYEFDGLMPGFYTVWRQPDRCSYNTTPAVLRIVLLEGGDFLAARFGVVPIRDCP